MKITACVSSLAASLLMSTTQGFMFSQGVPTKNAFSIASPLSIVAHNTGRKMTDSNDNEQVENDTITRGVLSSRRSILLTSIVGSIMATATSAAVAAEESSAAFEGIAARAAKISAAIEEQQEMSTASSSSKNGNTPEDTDKRTAYDFSLPVAGEQVTFAQLIKQDFPSGEDERKNAKVKAVLVVNIKQDDPIARKNIPELINLAAKFGPSGFAVVCLPTDQGYYEPDTSALIRLKMASEYGYGINPATALTDKVNILGTGAHPFMRWIQGKCRTPAGLGKIEGNFEKFLVDGRTGLPLRRYPRKYSPFDISSDIQALVNGQKLPPAIANFQEEWRGSAYDSKQDTYRFQKGLNVFDQ